MPQLYPLRFEPLFRRYIWGGRRLASHLQKPIGEGDDYAESWEVVDHGNDQSVVAAGSLKGSKLHELVEQHGVELFGQHAPRTHFPLLFKFLDAHRNLSVQVHPDDARAALLDPPDLGKTEAWVVMHAEPGATIYSGLKTGSDRADFAAAINEGRAEACLHQFHPEVGDCLLIQAGTVHALGEGLLVAEIQQASDTTYRLFDWNRVGADGKPRDLHIEAGLEATDFDSGPINPIRPQVTPDANRERLVACDKFVLDRCQTDTLLTVGGDDRFHLMTVLEGEVTIEGDPMNEPLKLGQSALLPASLGDTNVTASSRSTILDMYLPDEQGNV